MRLKFMRYFIQMLTLKNIYLYVFYSRGIKGAQTRNSPI
jgi:hypothetical protein